MSTKDDVSETVELLGQSGDITVTLNRDKVTISRKSDGKTLVLDHDTYLAVLRMLRRRKGM